MLRAIELTTTVIFYDQPLACAKQLHYENVKRKIFVSTMVEKFQYLRSWNSLVGAGSELILFNTGRQDANEDS